MRRIWLVAMFLCVLPAGGAQAAGYDDFALGISANAQGAFAAAIDHFSAAIAASDLSPALLPQAYRGRAVAYARTDKCGEALADMDHAVALKPDSQEFRWLHADAAQCANKPALAMADYNLLIAANAGAGAYWARGYLRWNGADFAGALEDFRQDVRLAPQDAYGVLWRGVSAARAGTLDIAEAAAGLGALRGHAWPQPLLAVYAGSAKPDTVAAAVLEDGDKELAKRHCEADFYLAEWWLGQNAAASAKPLLERAAAQCPHDFIEFRASRIELDRLK